jgi:leukotriene-A4 hydrolase
MLPKVFSSQLGLFAASRYVRVADRLVHASLRSSSACPLSRQLTRMASTIVKGPRDPNTLSNYQNWITTHSTATFDVNFEEQRLGGHVAHKLRSTTDAATKEIILDSSHVDIQDVHIEGKSVKWELLPRMEPFGSALKISLNHGVPLNESIDLTVLCRTTPSCTALQWMTPAQTSNKKHPYMFSQCQAIHARSLFPCQDTPDVKCPYDFYLTSPLPVIASGLQKNAGKEATDSRGYKLYHFHQSVPIPSYLFAIASGDIAIASIGPRSTVATGPDELADCKWELEADTERFIKAGESLVYPYAWGEYNVLVLPPSFPYGYVVPSLKCCIFSCGSFHLHPKPFRT